MVKSILLHVLVGCFIGFSIPKNSHAQSFNSSTNQVNIALGLGKRVSYNTSLPPIRISYEKFIKEIGAGKVGGEGVLGFTTGSIKTVGLNTVDFSTIQLGVKGNWYWDDLNTDKYNVYGGLGLGMWIDNSSNLGVSSSLYLMLGLGGRYFNSDKLALFSEVGNNLSSIVVGATLKLH